MKKHLALALAMGLALTTAACGDKTVQTPPPSTAPVETPTAVVEESSLYRDYYDIVSASALRYGICADMVMVGRSQETGVVYGSLRDLNMDGKDELVILSWEDKFDLWLRVYTEENGRAKMLMEQLVPLGLDCCMGIEFLDGGEYFVGLEEDHLGDGSEPGITTWLYSMDSEGIHTTTFRTIYDQVIGSGNPAGVGVTYYIGDTECSEAEYQEQCPSLNYIGFEYSEDQVTELLRELAERAEIPQAEADNEVSDTVPDEKLNNDGK